jgi:hypothetical protein
MNHSEHRKTMVRNRSDEHNHRAPGKGRSRAIRTGGPAAVFTALLGAAAANAHETWLLPADFAPEPGRSVEFRMTSGMGFPGLGSGIDRRRVAEAVLHQDGDSQGLVPSGATEGALELSAIPGPGLACAWVRLRSRILEIGEDEDVEHYLEEIGAPESVWNSWRQRDAGTVWRESYSKLARTYLRGEARDGGAVPIESCLPERSEARFEILPLADPTRLAIGDALVLQVTFDGKPLAGQAVGMMREGAEPAPLVRSDADGRITITPSGPGRHMVYATNLRPAEADDHNWESDFITLTFEVPGP